ncbi:MAG TPA: copper chaperone CopZ [Bacillota bacterium]|nr:copper chaperone CopZ [Bacillota bacterium]
MSVSRIDLNVEGMSCQHCVHSIEKAVGALKGVEGVAVDLDSKKVSVAFNSDDVSVETIKAAIEDQGYDVV